MKVLLIYSNVMNESWIPIGLLYIAANLRKHGVTVQIVDSKYHLLENSVRVFQPDYIGLGGMTVMAPHAIATGKMLKEKFPNIWLVYGGVHFTFLPDDAKPMADFIIKGEAENVFVDIVTRRKSFRDIPGLIYEQLGQYLDNGDWELIKELDALPIPAYELIDITKYKDELATGEKAISIMTGRGCPYNCTFCASPALWKRQTRYHSLNYNIKHIKRLIEKYNLKYLRIMDDTFTCSNNRVLAFCDRIIKEKIKLNMSCLTNVKNADLKVFQKMKQAGFSIVAFGLESVDPKVLKLCNKNNTRRNMTRAVNLAHEAGLKTELLFMVGNCGDTVESLYDSLQFSKELNAYKVYFQFATPFPGSKFYEIAEQYGTVIDRDWSQYNHKQIKYIPYMLNRAIMIGTVKRGTTN